MMRAELSHPQAVAHATPAPAHTEPAPVAPLASLAAWPRTRCAIGVRTALRWLLLNLPVRRWCSPMCVSFESPLPEGPLLLVANHASHADTAVILAALPRRVRARTAPAGAADYFFRNRVVGALSSLIVGAFPFPRHGREGLRNARSLLASSWSVLLFPEGTRSVDGRIAPLKPGAAMLAASGGAQPTIVVPVGIAGTRDVLGKGRRLPKRAPVTVVFGAPMSVPPGADVQAVTNWMEQSIRRLAAKAERERAPRTRTLHEKMAEFASSRIALWFVAAWGIAEAIAWPIVPDLIVAVLVLAAPRRILHLAAAAIAGMAVGGSIAYILGSTEMGFALLERSLLVTKPMRSEAAEALQRSGGAALMSQPLSGIPFKVYALQAADTGVGYGSFLGHALLARGARIFAAGAVFAALGMIIRPIAHRIYGALVLATTLVFFASLAFVVVSSTGF